jgi:Zn-finger nucleic acid-binding protein
MAKNTDRCPECQTFLSSMPLATGAALACRTCAGVSVNVAVLRQHAPEAMVQALWSAARDSGRPSTRPCPSCEQFLRTFAAPGDGDAPELDACPRCQLLWFDGQELERAGLQLRPSSAEGSDTRHARGLMESQLLHDQAKFETAAEFVRVLMLDVWYFRGRW